MLTLVAFFQSLIEKDWLAFGHKFSERCGHVAGEVKERSPVFAQMLDGVWQLARARPAAFQFTERFLLALHDHAQAAQYGTFVGNCEKDRLDLRYVLLILYHTTQRISPGRQRPENSSLCHIVKPHQ